MWEAYYRIYGGGPVVARSEIEIYALSAVNARLLDPAVDLNYYRNFERTHKEIIEELVKLKKLENEEGKDKEIEDAYRRIRNLADKGKKEVAPQSSPAAVPQVPVVAASGNGANPVPPQPMGEMRKEEKTDPNLIQSLLSLFRK